jgi:phenylacetate-coenzyme A ligase PaaK-like adenylate-forming protein
MPWKKKQLAVSSALWPIDKIVAQLNEFQPAMLGGYPSHLELLSEEAEAGRLRIQPVIIMTGGEYLSDALRQKLADTFHCYVQTSYSCTEGGTVACECTHRHFHVNDDWLIVEAVDGNGEPVADGVQAEKIFLTNLYNYTQPYIRYEVTDRVIMHHEPCPCGNPSPWLELEGRTDDVTEFREGDETVRIAPLSFYALLKEIHGIRRFQLAVYPENRIEVRLEEKEGTGRQAAFEAAKTALTDYLASQNVHHAQITLAEEPPRQDKGSGKFKHIISCRQETPKAV